MKSLKRNFSKKPALKELITKLEAIPLKHQAIDTSVDLTPGQEQPVTGRTTLSGRCSLQILVEGFPANTNLTSNLRFTHPRLDPLAQFCNCRLR